MNIKYEFDTICALATPFGVSGVAVIRISGDKAWNILKNIFSKKDIQAGKIFYGWIVENEQKIDEVIVLPFKAPSSFTGEDVVEIQCHGGINVINKIIELVCANGARIAQKGEFTKRAFMNGRLDLPKAEAINDIIHAKSVEFAQKSATTLSGTLSKEVKSIRDKIFNLLSVINAAIDFPEDVPEPEYDFIAEKIDEITKQIKNILNGAKTSNLMRDGIKIAIIGKPNAGKSSLFNRLLNFERAIVTQIAGTTRDILSETICIGGIPVTFIDTAGIRKEENINQVEAIGIDFSIQSIENADIILFIYDAFEGFTSDDNKIFELVKNKTYIKIGTKSDLLDKNFVKENDTLYISNLKNENIDLLKNKISEKILEKPINETDFVTNTRQQACLEKTLVSLELATKGVKEKVLQDLISIDIKSALLNVDEISGEVITDRILDNIFENFCIGK